MIYIEQLEERCNPSALIPRLHAEIPILNTGASDFAKTTAIREWAYLQADYTLESSLTIQGFRKLSAVQMLQRFDVDTGGVACGGTAYFLSEIYRVLGFWSATASAQLNGASHVTTLVVVRDSGITKTIMQDATSNSTLLYANGTPADFNSIMTAAAAGTTSQFTAQQSHGTKEQLSLNPDFDDFANGIFGPQYADPGIQNANGTWVFPIHNTLVESDFFVPNQCSICMFTPTATYGIKFQPGYGDPSIPANPIPGWTGQVFTAFGDVNGDGVKDVIAAAGFGGGPRVVVIDGFSGETLRDFFAYNPSFIGGVTVAVNDFDGDGYADIATAAGIGGGPHVKVFNGATNAEDRSYMAYDPSYNDWVGLWIDSGGNLVTVAGPQQHTKHWDYATPNILEEYFAI